MAVANKKTLFVSGALQWAKVIGAPTPNYNKDGREWTFELQLNEESLQKIIKAGLADRIKGRGYNIGTKGQHKEREPFIQLKKPEFRRDGTPNEPIRVYDEDNVEWDSTKLIGNDSAGDVKLDVRDYGPGKKMGVYPVAIRVTNLNEYKSSEFGAMDNENEVAEEEPKKKVKAKANVAFDEDLDDDIPF